MMNYEVKLKNGDKFQVGADRPPTTRSEGRIELLSFFRDDEIVKVVVLSEVLYWGAIEECLRDGPTSSAPHTLSPDQVINAVAEVFVVDASLLRRPGKGNRSVSKARDVAAYLLRKKCDLTCSEIGNLMGGRPHSTILAALDRYSERRKTDLQLIEAERQINLKLR